MKEITMILESNVKGVKVDKSILVLLSNADNFIPQKIEDSQQKIASTLVQKYPEPYATPSATVLNSYFPVVPNAREIDITSSTSEQLKSFGWEPLVQAEICNNTTK